MAGIAALAAAYILSQFYRSFLAVLTPVLISELGATKAELSAASGAWFAAFALMQFIVGMSLDKYGPRRTVSVLLGLCGGGGALLFSFSTAPWMIILAMTMIGAGCSPVLMSSIFIFANTFRPARLAVLTSWMIAFGSAGNVVGTSPLAAASEAFGWRPVMGLLCALSILTALALFTLVRDPPKAESDSDFAPGFSGFVDTLKLRLLWPIIPLIALNYTAAVGIRGLWAGPYLADVYGANSLMIGNVTLFMALAMTAGAFVYGPLDTIFGTRKWVAVIGNGFSVAVIGWLAVFPVSGISATIVAFILVGLFGSSYALLMAHARAFIPAHLTGRGMALMNFFSIGGVGVMQFLTGAVVTATTVPDMPERAYSALFAFYSLTLGASLIVYLLARDDKPEKNEAGIEGAARRSN